MIDTVSGVGAASVSENPLITIVIPARNEAECIADTLDACLAIDYERKEIIVVDDSSDETPQIVARYAARGVRLIHREVNRNGCCGARNLGMQSASGEIVILMNADDRPRPDFLRRILPHYQQGADCLVVQSMVLNRDTPWGQYLYARGRCKRRIDPHWSEGFSCRRQAVEVVNYIPGDFPLPFCRDNMLSQEMVKAGHAKHIDLSIVMEHLVPATLTDFWRNRVWRGTIAPLHNYYFGGMSVPLVMLRELAKAVKTVLLDLLIFPLLVRGARYARYATGGFRDLPVLVAVGMVHDLGVSAGNLKGAAKLARAEGFWRRRCA